MVQVTSRNDHHETETHQLLVAGKCVCGVEFKDPSDPHHALRCKYQYAPSRVHDAVKLVVAKIAKASGGVVTIEDDTLLPGKRVDVAVRKPMDGEKHALESEAEWVERGGGEQEFGEGAPWVDVPYLVDMRL
ncbi:unnamed protein product [Closterium sp. NIES-65]|nr:unnamed protein product [Closterium sp. NIES-65]CAI6011480.1 unnamed protein product [Closterium sp. NIES-65]